MINAVGEGNHAGSRETPAEASSDHGYEGFHPQFIKFRAFFGLVNAGKLSGVGVCAEHGIDSFPFFVIFISVLVDVLD